MYVPSTAIFSTHRHRAPSYRLCSVPTDVVERRRRRSKVVSENATLSTFGRRGFAVAGPSIWNSLPAYLRESDCNIDSFRLSLETFFCYNVWYSRTLSALGLNWDDALQKLTFTVHLHLTIQNLMQWLNEKRNASFTSQAIHQQFINNYSPFAARHISVANTDNKVDCCLRLQTILTGRRLEADGTGRR